MNTARKTIRYYWRHLRRFPRFFIPVAVILPINTLVNNYLPPLILAVILNRLSKHDYSAHHIWANFGSDLLLYLFLSLVGGTVLWRLFDMFYWRLEGKVERSIYQEVFSHLIDQSADFHANQFAGSLVSATNKLAGAYTRLADTMLFQVAPLFFGLAFVTIVMSFRAPLYTVLLLTFSILYILISLLVSGKVRRHGAKVANAESHQTGMLADALTNVMAIKSFARESQENHRFKIATDDTYGKFMGMMYAFQRQQIYLSSVTGILSGVALLIAVLSVVSFGANLATAFLIFNYTSSIASQLFTFSNNSLRNFNRSFGDAADMVEILQLEPEVQDPAKPEKSRIRKGNIEFRNVVFTHNGADDALFDNLNLEIKSGEKVGLVGHSGSGKTTFTRLLLRFSDIDGGEILIDGQNIARIIQDDLRSAVAYVPQEPLLFHRTIRENIAYGKPGASEKEVLDAARKANAHDFIEQLPQGYGTLVGERGVKLSGGQRQRVAIARAILKDAPILLLDEATSSLDSESEALIQDALRQLMADRTAIIIAHRLSTIQKMDRIIVLSDGEVVEQGSHRELLKHKTGTYAKLWAHQSGGFIEE
ncbi:MAG TPA: ABC transporter ATP-binding protein [Candidatus Saccharimonadales bacterium]|jgi:ATP-binding cassette subfamily B protein